MPTHYKTCVLDEARVTYWFAELADFLLPKANYRCRPNVRALQHGWLATCSEAGPSSPMEQPITAMRKRPQDGAPSPAHTLVCFSECFDQRFLLKHVLLLLEESSTPTTLSSSHASWKRFTSSACWSPFREARVRAFFDTQDPADVCLGSVQSRSSVCLA